jgi:hypothetical protein
MVGRLVRRDEVIKGRTATTGDSGMRHRAIILSFTLALAIGVGVYVFYSFSKDAPGSHNKQVEFPETVLQAPTPQRSLDPSVPPSPPARDVEQPAPEPPRRLVGLTNERLKQIEQSLPKGSQIYLSPIGNDKSVAALVNADLYGDRRVETIVVHTVKTPTSQEPTPPLVLSILTPNGGGLSLRASVPLTGGVLFKIETDGSDVPVVVSDVTGDHRPEIIVASGIGASLGGVLQVFRADGSSLVSISQIEGNLFRVHGRVGPSSIITAQSRYEKKPVSYRWNGQQFVPTN